MSKANAVEKMAQQAYVQVFSQMLPRLDLTTSNQKITNHSSQQSLESLLLDGRTKVYQATTDLSLSLNLYNGGANIADLTMAKEKIKEASYNQFMQRRIIAHKVLEELHGARQSAYNLVLAQQQLALLEKQHQQAMALFELGKIAALQFREIAFELKNAELSVLIEGDEYQRNLDSLVLTVGIEGKSWRPASPTDLLTQDDYQQALKLHQLNTKETTPSMKIANSKVRQAQSEVRLARSTYLPEVNLFSSVNYSANTESNFGNTFNDQSKEKSFIGLSISWNLFDGFYTTAGLRKAQQSVLLAKAERDIGQLNEATQAINLQSNLHHSQQNFFISQQRLELIQLQMAVSKEKLALRRTDSLSHDKISHDLSKQMLIIDQLQDRINYYRAQLTFYPPSR